jgi:hypothetical protein
MIEPEGLPIRAKRHIPNSIATVRRRLTIARAKPATMSMLRQNAVDTQ